MRRSGWLASGMLALGLVGMLGSAAFADAVSERQALMKQADAALKDARRAAPAQAVDMARFLQQAFKTAPGLFAPGTEGGRAKPEVWSNRAAFNAAMGAAQKAADDIRAAAASGDAKALKAATDRMGDACGNCHRSFRSLF